MGRALVIVACGWMGASSAFAQTRMTSLEELRRELAAGDVVTVTAGWAIDAAHSKPPIRFDAPPPRRTSVGVTPLYSPRRGVGIAVAVSR